MKRNPLREPAPPLPLARAYLGAVEDGLVQIEPPTKAVLGTGAPQHIPTAYTRRQVEMMVAYGLKQEEVAHIVGMSTMTLAKHYRDELTHGLAKVNAMVATRLFDIAMHGQGKEAITALIFWMKTRGGWQGAVQTHVIQGDPNNPIQHEHSYNDHATLTHQDRAARLLQLLNDSAVDRARLPFVERLDTVETPTGTPDARLLVIG